MVTWVTPRISDGVADGFISIMLLSLVTPMSESLLRPFHKVDLVRSAFGPLPFAVCVTEELPEDISSPPHVGESIKLKYSEGTLSVHHSISNRDKTPASCCSFQLVSMETAFI